MIRQYAQALVLGGMTADGQTIFKIFNGFELALGFGREYGDAYSWDCPHDDYTIIDEKNPDFLGGFDFLRRTTFSDDFALYGGVGLYVTTSSTIAESNVTGWRYIHGSEVDTAISYSYGIQIKRLIVGFHSIRGNYVAIVLGKF